MPVDDRPPANRHPDLVVFAGLPGSGKSVLARGVAAGLGATFLRIDTLEAAIASTLQPFRGNPVGYVAAEWVAQDQLSAGRDVVVDAVNNSELARGHWRRLATRTDARLTWVLVTCSDAGEHRRRVEGRTGDWPGHGVPTWEQVQNRPWEPFAEPTLAIDNVGDAQAHIAAILEEIGRLRS